MRRVTTIKAIPLAAACDVAACGGKAANLARLLSFGVPVPDGVVLTHEVLSAHFSHSRSREPGGQAALWQLLTCAPVIVRSSAIGEDSEDASFAGQLDSVPHVRTADELEDAIARVWASQKSPRVQAYQRLRNTPLAGMGIVIQRQVEAAVSGVLFTESPTSATDMLLEYCAGFGEALVQGNVNPGRIVIARGNGHRWKQLVEPESRVRVDAQQIATLAQLGLQIERAFGRPQDIEWTIDSAGKLWIVQSRPITARKGERAIPGCGRTYAFLETAQEVRACGRSHVTTQVWSNANVNENFPAPVCPLLYSMARVGYYHYFRNLGRAFGISSRRLKAMDPALRQIIGVHGGRMYYNLTSIHAVLRSAPFGDLLAASFNQFVGAEDTTTAPAGAAYRFGQVLELLVIAVKTTWQYLFVTRRVETFERTVDAYAGLTHPDHLLIKPTRELLQDLRCFMDIRCHRWKNASLADAGAMVCYGLLQRLLTRAFPNRDQQALHNTLLKALPNLVSGMPPIELWKLSRMVRDDRDLRRLVEHGPAEQVVEQLRTNPRFDRFRQAFDAYLENWGFRCSSELMLTTPTFQEEPGRVIELLRGYVATDSDSPAELLQRQAEERVRETDIVMRALRRRSWPQWFVVRTILRWTQCSIQLRERARLKQALLYSRLRRVAIALGERLAGAGLLERADDVFLLTITEVELLASGGEMFPAHVTALVTLRRSAHADVSATTPPDSLELNEGEYFTPEGANPLRDTVEQAGHTDLWTCTGTAACGGTSTARAAILMDVTDSEKLAPGDILVTRQTDPGWAPIFPLISGLVIERGGMLSHGAIIAREFGIPSVVGVKDATRRIAHHSRITVDGNSGLVHLTAGGA